MRSGGARVRSWPLNRMVPEVARSSPDRRFKKVDLPAPLGPMTACTSPAVKAKETLSTAASAPKRRESCTASSTASATRASQDAGDAAREEQYDDDDEAADQRAPVRRDLLAIVFDEGEEQRADHRAIQGPLAAQQHGHEQQPGLPPAELCRVDESVERGIEVPCEPRERASDDERDQLITLRREAERAHPLLIAADADEHVAKRRPQHPRQDQIYDNERHPDADVRSRTIGKVERPYAGAIVDIEPVGAAEIGRLVEHVVEHLRERQRHHDEVNAAGAQAEPADHDRSHGGASGAERQAQG